MIDKILLGISLFIAGIAFGINGFRAENILFVMSVIATIIIYCVSQGG